MPEITLLPCPFCGGEAEIRRYGNRRQSTVVGCTDCHCELEGPEEFNHGSQWNTRESEKSLRERVSQLEELLEVQRNATNAVITDKNRIVSISDTLIKNLEVENHRLKTDLKRNKEGI